MTSKLLNKWTYMNHDAKTPTLTVQTTNVALLVLNIVGAITYVYRASPSWAIPEERAAGIYTITGEPFVWFAGILPVIAIFLFINLTWGVIILKRRQWRSGCWWLFAASGWIVAVAVDFAHH